MNIQKLKEIDIQYLWHPYTDIDSFEKSNFPIIKKAKGCYLYDHNDNKYLDGIASWWCVNFGHSHPELIKAIKKQSENLQNVILGGMSHEKAILLSKKLAEYSVRMGVSEWITNSLFSAVETSEVITFTIPPIFIPILNSLQENKQIPDMVEQYLQKGQVNADF